MSGSENGVGGGGPIPDSEMEALRIRRERSDLISKRMGDCLLRGHKMLATSCKVCNTIEFQDKDERTYCIACTEIDRRDQAVTQQNAPAVVDAGNDRGPVKRPSASKDHCGVGRRTDGADLNSVLGKSMDEITKKMRQAVDNLGATENVELSRSYILLIKDCADALLALKQAEAQSSSSPVMPS